MRPLEELTMYANGLLEPEEMSATSAHVDACLACARTVERLRFERRVVQTAAARPDGPGAPADFPAVLARRIPAPRYSRRLRVSLLGLAGAAGLLLALALLLFERPQGPSVNFAAQAPNDPLDRLIQELRSPSKARKAVALEALKSFGEAAAVRLEKEGLDPAQVRGDAALSAGDQALQKQLHSVRTTIDLQNAPLLGILRHLETVLGRPIVTEPSDSDASKEMVSFKVQDIVLDGALRLMLQPRNRTYEVRGGMVRVVPQSDSAPAYRAAPVRVLRDSSGARAEVAKLSSRDPAERAQASAALRRLGFGAEPALWDALEAANPEARAAVGELLGQLYQPRPILGSSPAEARLRRTPLGPILKQGTLLELCELLMKDFGVSLAFDAVRARPEAIRDEDLFGSSALEGLSQMLVQAGLKLVFVGDMALATSADAPALSRSWNGPAWTSPEKARELETLLADLASDDVSRQGLAEQGLLKIGADALVPLGEAAQIWDAPAARRCRQTRRRILDAGGLWWTDEPSGAELQSRSPAQRELLAKPVDLVARGLLLQELLVQAGVKADFRIPADLRIQLFARALPLGSLLKAVTRPYGMDFYLDGTTVVIDTAQNVRAALEK
jgi:hypothetical protein